MGQFGHNSNNYSNTPIRILTNTELTCMRAKFTSVGADSLQPYGLYPPHQALLFMGFSRQEYWSGLLYPPPGDFPDPGIASLMFPVLADRILTTSATWEAPKTELSLY